jgi:hypothetical protein
MMVKRLYVCALMALVAFPAHAGFINIRPGQWFSTAGLSTPCAPVTRSGTNGPQHQMACEEDEDFYVEMTLPQNVAGGNVVCTATWEVLSDGTDEACLRICNAVCEDGDNCPNLATANCQDVVLLEHATTQSVDIADAWGAFSFRRVTAAANCTGGNCAGSKVRFYVKRDDTLCSTGTLSNVVPVNLSEIVCSYDE